MKGRKEKILFVHSGGAQGLHEGSSGLLQYLRMHLGHWYDIVSPAMPHPERPMYGAWRDLLSSTLSPLHEELVLIGHSLGGSVLLKFLSEEPFESPVAGLFLIAAPYWGKRKFQAEEYRLRDQFSDRLPSIRQVFIYHARHDEVVPFKHAEFYSAQLPGAVIREFEGSAHLFSSGLPELVEDIRDLDFGWRVIRGIN
jgi:predicted alpha/beta hydrolase family esterase